MCHRYALQFGDLEFKRGLSRDTQVKLRKVDKEFQGMDTRILYSLVFLLIANIVVLSAVVAGKEDTDLLVQVQSGALVLIALIVTLVRIWNFKYCLLHPIIALWKRHEGDAQDRLMFGFTIAIAVVAIILMMVSAVVITNDEIKLGLALSLITCFVLILASLTYRLHAGSYIQWARDHDIHVDDGDAVAVPVAVH